jgi:hypothetical protein
MEETSMKRTGLIIAAAIIAAVEASAQASLSPSAKLPKIDGTIGAGEYAYEATISGIKLGTTLGSDGMLYMAVQAPTSGWVAVGTGGLIMNGSRLYFGAIQGGKPAFAEMTGAGHGAVPAKTQVVKKWAVASAGGATTLELVLASSDAVWKGSINSIFAYAVAPDFRVRHKEEGSVSYAIK